MTDPDLLFTAKIVRKIERQGKSGNNSYLQAI